ncbi:uncharacterized protein PAC_16233 [Phialocephala subalpina]|uniref:Dynamin N-terminal domain-containing protein n=1 Tax=Phialocephala subalpina TaxID=576137 RepID=A0A1L7XMS1_9HELO|nr:uncharacterized protein PAC_16233 [Phialocephala subalpina]
MAKTRGDFDVEPGSLFDDIQVQLFDSMYRLTGLVVSGDIEPPQLVVVGAQNSGKSSVLEALVKFHFPVDSEKPTTRFPIRLVLRKADKETTKVRIEPEKSRSEERKRSLDYFAESLSVDNNFDRIMKSAKAELGVFPPDIPSEIPGNLKIKRRAICVITRPDRAGDLDETQRVLGKENGKTKVEIEAERATTPTSHSQDPMSKQHGDGEPHFQPHGTKTYCVHDEPERQGRKEYEKWVCENMDYWESKWSRESLAVKG